jgi:hypothetical protein
VGAVIDRNDGDSGDSRIAELARELASAINRADAEGRTEMRDLAIDVLKESVRTTGLRAEPQAGSTAVRAPQTLNPFALGIPLLLVGPFLGFLFPPVGILLLLAGLVACSLGIVLAAVRTVRGRRRSGDGR